MIKFRGVRLSNGQTIYGYYHERGGEVVDGKGADCAKLTASFDASLHSVTLKRQA